MKNGTDRSPRDTKRNKYVSSIRINGVSIIPPLITPEKRKELRRYKREAIKVEKRLQRERELKTYISQMCQTCTNELNDGLNSTIEDLVDKVETNFNDNSVCDAFNQLEYDTRELLVKSLEAKPVNRTFSIYTQVTQYINEDKTKSAEVYAKSGNEDVLEETMRSKTPKLIRRNSYILDAPSPALIQYLKSKDDQKESNTNCWESKLSPKESICSELKDECDLQSEFVLDHNCIKNINIDKFIQDGNNDTTINHTFVSNKANDETFCNNTTDQTFINNNTANQTGSNDLQVASIDGDDTPRCIDNLYKSNCLLETKVSALNISDDYCDSSRTETELRNLSDCESNLHEFIANNMPHSAENLNPDISDVTSHQLSPRSDLNGILRNIPAEYSRQILDILERQQLSTCMIDNFDDIHNQPEKYSTPHDTTILGDTVYYSIDDQVDETKINQPMSNVNSEKLNKEELHQAITNFDSGLLENGETFRNTEANKQSEQRVTARENQQIQICSKQTKEKSSLFKAASVINAAAKGFLVRRLMKTEKVQNLIQTIKEAVLCAVQLHHDTLDHIEAADVELHRRLIQQVSAACYSFHDVFFSTSIQDQMSFISVDRQKKREKLRRISSGHSISSSRSSRSTHSTGRSRKFSLRP